MNKTTKSLKSLPLVSEQALTVGDRVQTPTGRIGVIILPDADMPLHHLVLFDDGDRAFWMLREILQSGPVPDPKSGHTTKADTRRSHPKNRTLKSKLAAVETG